MKILLRYLIILMFAISTFSCKKSELLPEKSFASINVRSKSLVNVPSVLVYVDSTLLDTLDGGAGLSSLLSREKPTMKLSIRDLATGKHLLDSVFKVQIKNNFTFLIDNALGLASFYTPSTKVVSKDSCTFQLFYNSDIGIVPGRKLRFEVYSSPDRGNSFERTSYPDMTVEKGKLSAVYTLPAGGYTATVGYYLKTYDAETGELVCSFEPGFFGYGSPILEQGKNLIFHVKFDYYPDYGNFYNLIDSYPL